MDKVQKFLEAQKTAFLEAKQAKIPEVKSGDLVRVWVQIQEAGKERLTPFEGIVIARKHGQELGATITVRAELGGYGVEQIFPIYSPNVAKIEVLKHAKVRRAKLYYLRQRTGRKARLKMVADKRLTPNHQRQGTGQATDNKRQKKIKAKKNGRELGVKKEERKQEKSAKKRES
jgi:large subunit ribosomal protein L19